MKKNELSFGRQIYPARRRGSILAVVLILCLATLFLVGSFLRSAGTQARTNSRATLLGEARNAAEGVAEYALAEMNRRASANPSFGAAADPLAGFTLPTADLDYLAPGTGNNHVVSAHVGFKAGDFIAAGVMRTLDVDDPVNISDGEKGKLLNIREMQIFGKAAVRDPLTQSLVTSYIAETVQVREQSWFNYAIFFNMDMEFHSQTTMDIFGPVFTNASAYVAAGSGEDLNFYSNFSAFQKIIRGVKYNNGGSSSHSGDVFFIDAGGMNASDLTEMGTSQDSNTTAAGGFRTLGRTRWNDFVQDQSYSVARFNPPGLPAYSPEDFSTVGRELRNNAWIMIESQLSNLPADADYGQKGLATENLKLSALSGFVIQVDPPASIYAQPKWRILVYQASDVTRPISQNNPPARSGVNGKPIIAQTIDPFLDQDGGAANNGAGALPVNGAAPATWKMKRALKTALLDAIVSVPYGDAGTVVGTSWGNGFSNLRSFSQGAPATTATTYYPVYDRREGYVYPNSSTSTTNLLKGAMHVLRVDMGKLNALINNTTGIWNHPDPGRSAQLIYSVSNSYTGVVYVQFPLATLDPARFPSPIGSGATDSDKLRPAIAPTTTTPGYAVVVANAGTLPQRLGGSPDGFTIATNAPLYVNGHYNADGNSGTGSATAADSAFEIPAMIAADSVTILSPGFNFRQMATTQSAASGFTEISAAIVTGLVPTRPGANDIWAGGVHNFARFHENWSGRTYRYRGSLAALFECEVTKAPWRQTYYSFWYTPPSRDVGYHQYLAGGRFPPGTPVKRTVRRINLQDITAGMYNTGP